MARNKNLVKKVQKKHPISFIIILVVFVVAICGGYFTSKTLTKDDKFEIIGEKEITLTIGDDYIEEGAIAIAFGRDISSQIEIDSSNLDITQAGEYYIKYSVDNYLYKNVFRYRYVIVEENLTNEGTEVIK